MNNVDVLAVQGVDPAALDAAPAAWPATRAARARLAPPDAVPCSACGAMAIATRIIDHIRTGPRWLDTCRTHLLVAHGKTGSAL